MRLEVAVIPVSVDRALISTRPWLAADADLTTTPDFRVAAHPARLSLLGDLRHRLTTAAPGSTQDQLVVDE
jgi:hypothetical protein